MKMDGLPFIGVLLERNKYFEELPVDASKEDFQTFFVICMEIVEDAYLIDFFL